MSLPQEILCVDPGLEAVDHEACAEIKSLRGDFSFSHHLVGMKGVSSLYEREKDICIKGIIILGSIARVNESSPWQEELNPWLLEKMNSGVPTLGICYGHQLIAKLFGGKIAYLRSDRSKFVGFRSFELFGNCPLDLPAGSIEVIASHCEEVKELPSCLEVCGASDEVAIEALCHKKLPIIGFQSHPEARADFCNERGVSWKNKKDPFAGGKSIIVSFMNYLGGA